MKHYTDTIPLALAEKLKEKGMPMKDAYTPILYDKPESVMSGCIIPTYAACFDWLMEKGLFVNIEPIWDFANELITEDFESVVIRRGSIHTPTPTAEGNTWHEAAEAAIEKALTLI